MKVKPKKNVEIPPDIRCFTDRIVSTPFELLGDALAEFSWKFDKGDFHHWIPLLNYFDAAFEKYTTPRMDLTLEGGFDDTPFPTNATIAILRVTTRILENCTNKHLYQSYDHLTQLLAAPEVEVVVWALQALVAFLRKTHHYTMRFHGYPSLNARLFDLCKGWGGKEQGLDMAACAHHDASSIADGIQEGTTLHFEFFSESQDRTFGRKVLRLENMHHQKHADHSVLQSLIQEHAIPQDLRFQLLTRIRVASRFGTLEGRRSLVKMRLLAFCVLIQSNPLHDEMLNFFTSEPEFMNELVELIQADEGISLDLRTLALRSITVQLVDRSRHNAVINAVGTGGSNGILAVLLQDAIDCICPGERPVDRKPKYNAAFVEALLVLIATLITSASGNVALNEAGFIPALLPLIKDRNATHVNLVCSAVKILEGFMDYSSTASALFRGMGGLSTMIARLEAEVHSDEGPSTSQGIKRKKSNEDIAKPQISYLRKLLMKSLLRAIALGSYAPSMGTASRPDEQDARILYKCLKSIFVRSKEFGGPLFAFAATVTTDLIHQDPLSFASLDAAGVPDAFLNAIEEGVLPSSDAVCSIPATLVAFCLNAGGLQKVTDRQALRCLVGIFTSKIYIKALSGDTGSILGAGIDELFRHVPTLKDFGIQHVIIQMLKVLCLMGGDSDVNTEGIPEEVIERSKQPGIDSSLPECVCHAAKMLESLLSNSDTARRFAQHGGVELLLKFYTLPKMPAAFGSLPQSPPLLSIFRSLTHNNCSSLHASVPGVLAVQLERTIQTAEKLGDACVPALDNEARELYIRSVASASGLIAVAGTIARSSTPMMTEMCKGDKTLIAGVGALERLLLHQLSLADAWKERKMNKKEDDDIDVIMDGVEEGENERTDTEADAMEIEPDFVINDLTPSDQDTVGQNRSPRRAPDDLAYDVLQQAAITIKNLYTAIAKAIHTPARRRDESFARPSLCMNAAALGLALVLKRNLDEEIPELFEPGLQRYVKHMTRVVEEVQSVLFDGRRHCCHTLILNYFVSIQGFTALIRRFEEAVQQLWGTLQDHSSLGPSSSTSQQESPEITPMESLIVAFLTLFSQMTNPRLLCQSAQTTSLLVLPLPNKEETEEAQDTNGERSEAFVKRLRDTVLRSVLPVWSHPLLARSPPGIARSVVEILNSCMDGTGSLSAAFRAIRSDGRYGGGRANPDPTMIQMIMDMGFTRSRAVQALRRIGQNSVEMALEWLVSNPEETTEQTETPQEKELADAMAASLTQIEAPVEAESSSEPVSESIRVLDLVTGAVAVLEKNPASAFSISTFVLTLCNRNEGTDRETILQWFIACLNKSIVPGTDFEAIAPKLNAVGHLLALLMSESAPCRELATEVDMIPSVIRALDEWERQYQLPQEIPTWIEGLLLVLDFLSQTQPPSPDTSDAEDSEEAREKTPLEKILSKWTPAGAVNVTQGIHLVDLCIKILKHLHVYGDAWKPSEQQKQHIASDPAGVTQAVLQLLASITRCHQTALKFLHKEGADLLMSLPASCVLPRLEPHISIILKHVLEDDVTLQSLMEGEIKNVFSMQRRPLGQLPFYDWERMPLRTFLQKTSAIAYRSPSIFSKAVANLCVISEANGNAVICLKRMKSNGKSGEKGTESSKKNSKKVLASFAEVIGKLIDHIVRFDFNVIPPLKSQTSSKMPDTNTHHPEASSNDNHPDSSIQNGPISREILMQNRDVIMQIMMLNVLSEYSLMYASTVGVLLKRDAEVSHRGPSNSSESPGVLKRLIHEHLSWKDPNETIRPGLSDEASKLLQAICLRSPEGRRRVLSEIVEVLRWACSALPCSPKQSQLASPFISISGAPSGVKLRSMIELIGSLLTAGSNQKAGNQNDNRQLSVGGGLTIELVRTMRDADVVPVLIKSLELVEMDHPDAAKAVHSIIKPLEMLTRSIPVPPKKTSPTEATPPTEPRTSRDGTDLMSASPPAQVELLSGELMEEDMHEMRDAHLLAGDIQEAELYYEALEDIDGMVEDTLQEAMHGDQGDPMEEDEDSESESSSGTHSFHEDASQDDHVVVDEESEEMENEQEEMEASDEEGQEEEDEDEMEDNDDDATADMELEEGDEWEDEPAIREYNEAMDRIEHALWGDGDDHELFLTDILANPPMHRDIRSVQGYMLGNLFPEVFQAGRRGIRYRLQTRERGNANNAPFVMPQLPPAQHRLLARPQQRNPNNEDGSAGRLMSDALGRRFGQIPQGGEGRWRQLAFPGARFVERHGGGFGVTVIEGERPDNAPAPVYVSTGMQWINTMQHQFEELLMQTLPREAIPPRPAQEAQPEVQGTDAPNEQSNPEVAPAVNQEIDPAVQQSTVEIVDQVLQQMAQETADQAVGQAPDLAEVVEDRAVEQEQVEVPAASSPPPAEPNEVVMEDVVDDVINVPAEQSAAVDPDAMEADSQPVTSEQPVPAEDATVAREEEEGQESLPAEILADAEEAGIDPTFLQELPRPLQLEVLSQHGVALTALMQSSEQPAEEHETEQEEAAVDPEFLAALPPDIREEVIESQRMAERRREVERRLTEGNGDEVANMIASLPDDIREEVLLYSGPDILANLPSNLLAEGQRMRERHTRHITRDGDPSHPLAANPFFRRLRQERQGREGKKKERKEEMEGPPWIDEEGLASLVSLLKMHAPMIKTQLQKLLLNLCGREDSRRHVAKLLVQTLRTPDPEASRNAASITRRVLDLLCYLARHPASKVAETLLDVHVAPSWTETAGKLPMGDPSCQPRALEVLLEMLGQSLCVRSVSTLEQNLQLLELVLQSAASKDNIQPTVNPEASSTSKHEPQETTNPEAPVASSSHIPEANVSLQKLSSDQLALLPGIIGRDGLTERAYKTAASTVKLMAEAAPLHQLFLLLAIKGQIQEQTTVACDTLSRMSNEGMDRPSMHALSGAGSRTLRLLHSVEALLSTRSQDRDASSEALAGISRELEHLWGQLSPIIAEIEKQIKSGTGAITDTNVSAKVLPSGAAQTLPFIESFFVLCGAQYLLNQSEGPSDTLTAFAERHRVLLNAFLRQTPALLEGSFKSLVQSPRLIDFDNKRSYFRSKIRPEERTHYGTLRINVRREHVFEDSFYQLRHRSSDELRCKLSVQFTGEEGIDAGGVSREWYQVMAREIFNPNLALFVAVPDGASTFQPNPNSTIQNDRGVNHLDFFKFVGRLVGKALYDGQLIDAHFTRSFYKHMLNQPLSYQDLEAVDLDFYKQMKWILENDITDVLAGQTFAAETDFFGKTEVMELKEGGSKLSITETNKKEYVNLMTKHKMTTAIRHQIKAFQEGFWELVPKELVSIFNDHELELIISGLPEVDVSDLKANTEYTGYTAASQVIQWFWSVVEEFDAESLAMLLQFVTGTSKVPLDGFQNLQGISGPQKFQIHKSYASNDRLPSAHTCFNQLDLPEYSTRENLKDRLLLAIHEAREGFGFG